MKGTFNNKHIYQIERKVCRAIQGVAKQPNLVTEKPEQLWGAQEKHLPCFQVCGLPSKFQILKKCSIKVKDVKSLVLFLQLFYNRNYFEIQC